MLLSFFFNGFKNNKKKNNNHINLTHLSIFINTKKMLKEKKRKENKFCF